MFVPTKGDKGQGRVTAYEFKKEKSLHVRGSGRNLGALKNGWDLNKIKCRKVLEIKEAWTENSSGNVPEPVECFSSVFWVWDTADGLWGRELSQGQRERDILGSQRPSQPLGKRGEVFWTKDRVQSVPVFPCSCPCELLGDRGTEHLEERLNYKVSDPLGMNRPTPSKKKLEKRKKKIVIISYMRQAGSSDQSTHNYDKQEKSHFLHTWICDIEIHTYDASKEFSSY